MWNMKELVSSLQVSQSRPFELESTTRLIARLNVRSRDGFRSTPFHAKAALISIVLLQISVVQLFRQ